MDNINIYINEEQTIFSNEVDLYEIKEKYKKNADLVILNGYPIKENKKLKDQDRVVLIKKGEKPKEEEFEALLSARHSPNVYKKLKKTVVGVAGLGGLGSNVAMSLARSGVGELVIVDYDVVEPSNLNRQNYYIEDIGIDKVEATKESIKKVNPYIKVKAIKARIDKENAKEIFSDCSIIVEAFDVEESKAELVNEILLNTDKTIVAASGMAGCFSSNIIKTRKINSRFYLVGDEINEAKEFIGLMSPRVGIAANHQANMVLRLILDEKEV